MPDVIIVGGGIIGAACARELTRGGASVALLERAELAAGASGRNHGLLLVPPDRALVPMAAASLEVYREVAARGPIPVPLDEDPIGFLVVAGDDESEQRAAEAEAVAVGASGVNVRRLEGSALRAEEPNLSPEMTAGWLLDDGRRVDPAALTVALAIEARERGASIRTHAPVRSLLREGTRVTGVATDEGAMHADTVVVAAGPWSQPLLRPGGHELAMAGARGWLLHLAPRERAIHHLVERGGWHTLAGEDVWRPFPATALAEGGPPSDVGTLIQPNRDGTVLVGGSMQRTVGLEPEDHTVPRLLASRATALVPSLGVAEVIGAWWGVRPLSRDGRPFVGRVGDGLVVATGHGSQGMILGGGTGRLVAATISGEAPPFEHAAFDPTRFEAT